MAVAGSAVTGLAPSNLTVFNGHLLFSGLDSSGKTGLWETDGTAAGTHELTGIVGASTANFAPSGLTSTTIGPVPGPVLTAGAQVTYVLGAQPVTLDAGLSVFDATAVSLSAATVRISANFVNGDTLSVGSPQTGIASQYNVATGVLTLSGAASLAAYQTELASITCAPAKATTSSRTITWSVSDGVNGSAPVTSQVLVSSPPPSPLSNLNIVFQNTSGQAAVWDVTGNARTGGGTVSLNPGPTWRAVGTGAFFTGDTADILWQNTGTGQAAVWEMDGNTRLGGGTVSLNPGPTWKAIGTGDFNGDGLSDILWQNTSTGQAAVWNMDGTTRLGGGVVSLNPGPTWKAVGTGDFNHDGDADILLQNKSTGQVAIWDMDGNTRLGGGVVSLNPGPAWHAIGSGDFYGNGLSDILFQNASTGQVAIWEMDGTTRLGGGVVSLNPGPSWHAIGTDGGADILFQNTSGQTAIWEMDGTTRLGGGTLTPNPGPSWHAHALT